MLIVDNYCFPFLRRPSIYVSPCQCWEILCVRDKQSLFYNEILKNCIINERFFVVITFDVLCVYKPNCTIRGFYKLRNYNQWWVNIYLSISRFYNKFPLYKISYWLLNFQVVGLEQAFYILIKQHVKLLLAGIIPRLISTSSPDILLRGWQDATIVGLLKKQHQLEKPHNTEQIVYYNRDDSIIFKLYLMYPSRIQTKLWRYPLNGLDHW